MQTNAISNGTLHKRHALKMAQEWFASLSTAKRAKRRVADMSMTIENEAVLANLDGVTVGHIPSGWSEITIHLRIFEKPQRQRG